MYPNMLHEIMKVMADSVEITGKNGIIVPNTEGAISSAIQTICIHYQNAIVKNLGDGTVLVKPTK